MSFSSHRETAAVLLLLVLAMPLHAPAEEAATLPAEMETVTVTGQVEDQLTGSNTLDRQTLDRLPGRNGSINEMLGILPGVQLGENARTSDNAGEILPPSLSISGGRFYENNFMIDGMGSNSLLDPAYSNTSDINRVPGHPQEAFLHPSLIDRVTVLRSNISARYGGFTGGVVDIQTRDPADTFGGQINLRHTRSEWTELHTSADRQAEYDYPTTGAVHPEFRKHDTSLSLDLPLTENSGLLVAVSRVYSDISLLLVDATEEQHRTLDNYFLKYVAQLSPDNRLTLSGSYTPYDADLFLAETVDSNYTISNEAYGLSAKVQSKLEDLAIELNLGYRSSSNQREAPANYFPWQVTPSKPWGDITDADILVNRTSREGSYGDLEQEQKSWTADLKVSMEPIQTAGLAHQIDFGASYEQVDGHYDRGKAMTYYSGVCGPNTNKAICDPALYKIVVCEPGSIDCLAGEQFMYQKIVYPTDATDATIRFYDAYLEDTMTWGRLTVRPGMRLSSDDLQQNDNWAPRLAVSYDLFGDGESLLIGGRNRYYGKTLLTHALAEERAPSEIWKRDNKALAAGNLPKPWTFAPKTVFTATRLADLKTPYTDEWTVGVAQKLFGGRLTLDYLERKGRDELLGKILDKDAAGNVYTEWTNDGRSDHQEATLSWERGWRDHYVLLSATWQETKTSNSSYDDIINTVDKNKDGAIDPVWYKDRIVDRADLPRPDFNREWTAALAYVGRLPFNFIFTNVTRYRSGYMALRDTKIDKILDSGEKLDIYDKLKQPESWIFDWRLDWEKALAAGHTLLLTMEINNVFDQRVKSGESIDVYDLGRQLWLGMSYKF